jgi:hemerythrin-like metal-binding protein
MPFMEWEDSFSVGIDKIDLEHKKIIEIINTLYGYLEMGIQNETTEALLQELLSNAQGHFKTEEDLFIQYKYPTTVEHKVEHQRFVEILKAFTLGYHEKEVGISLQIVTFLAGWLKGHFLGTDRGYIQYLSGKEI